jgi:hypothetical protein
VKRAWFAVSAIVAALGALAAVWHFRGRPDAVPSLDMPVSGASSSPFKPGFLTARPIGNPATPDSPAWISDLCIADLDGDGLNDVICCDARANRVCWIRQVRRGEYVEQPIGDPIAGPAHVAVFDFNRDGHPDVLVAAMGQIFPTNEHIGSVIVLENDGHQVFRNRVILENTFRVTDVEAGDLNGDGIPDLAVAQFGYNEGQVQWLENLGGWKFASHPLLGLSGAIHAPIVDYDRDGRPDIVAVVAQDWEEVWAFDNLGEGRFSKRILYGSLNKDYGSSGLAVGDVDGDGIPDLLYSNGDAFDFSVPGSRPWHGVQWLRNDGRGKFTFHRVGDLSGAYSPVVVDLLGTGRRDIVAVSGFNDWSKPDAVALMCFENDGQQHFTPRPLAYAPTHMVVLKAGDMNRDGAVQLVTGCFAFYPPYDRAARVMLWERTGRSK